MSILIYSFELSESLISYITNKETPKIEESKYFSLDIQ